MHCGLRRPRGSLRRAVCVCAILCKGHQDPCSCSISTAGGFSAKSDAGSSPPEPAVPSSIKNRFRATSSQGLQSVPSLLRHARRPPGSAAQPCAEESEEARHLAVGQRGRGGREDRLAHRGHDHLRRDGCARGARAPVKRVRSAPRAWRSLTMASVLRLTGSRGAFPST